MARPTNYSQELVDKAWEYVDGGWESHSSTIPSVVGLCRVINRSKSTIYDWAKDPEKEFSDIVEALNELQEQILKEKGLLGDFNASITKLILTKHGYSDKTEVQQETKLSIEGLSDAELERIVTGG
jgi:predicted RNA-binding protein with PUA-like domain